MTVSVVVPVYRSAATIEACLTAIADQTVPPTEVLLVDDRGGDEAVDIGCALLARRGVVHRVITHDRNRGIGAARNSGLAAARGEWVWFLDSDDRADPGYLATLLRSAHEHGTDLAMCRTLRVTPDGSPLHPDEPRWPWPALPGPVAAHLMLVDTVRAYSCNKLFRRAHLLPDGFDVGRSYEDFRPMLRVLLRTGRVALVDEPLYHYTVNPGSVSAAFGPHTADLLDVVADVHTELEAAGLARRWRTQYLRYVYGNGVLPLANMALRAEHARGADPDTRAAVSAARRRVRPGELARLVLAGRWRTAATAGLLKALPGLYGRGLAHR